MEIEIPYDFMPPEQHFASPAELLSAINRFQKTRDPFSGDERFTASEGTFELLSDEEDGYVLMPTTCDYAFLFRGQGLFFQQCLPTLLRQKRDADHLFLERMRVVEFELMLKQYPAVRFFEQEKLAVDYVGLAQHYGLLTDVLDLTSDVRTALFFAMCDYDSENDCYYPKSDDKEYVSYLYAFPVINEITGCDAQTAGDFLKKDLRVIGLQPFKRPGSQRGFSFHVRENNPFKGYLYSFSYSKKDSEEYYNMMINQRNIWEKDFIVDKTHLIRDTTVFTVDALALTNKRYGYGESLGKMQRRMNDIGIHFSGNVPWHLCASESKSLNEVFEKELKLPLLQQIVHRSMCLEDRYFPIMTLSSIGQQLLLQTIQGGYPCVEGYTSGINITLDEDFAFVGWSFDTARPQTIPDSNGKVTAFDRVLKNVAASLPKSQEKRALLKNKVDQAVKPFRMRRVFVPSDGGKMIYLDD